MKISFADFWDGFDTNNNFFLDLFNHCGLKYEISEDPASSNFLIYSCFGNKHYEVNRDKTKKIFYTGENTRPNYNDCDYSLSFDIPDYSGKNIRLPLWYLYINWSNFSGRNNPKYCIPLQNIEKNEYSEKEKTKFCSIVFNRECNNRIKMIDLLSKYKKIDCYGKNRQFLEYGEDAKYKTISEYRFNICFENSSYPGYHTEKLLHAKTAGCIPVYWGNKTVNLDFNPECFINLNEYSSIEEFAEKIISIDKDQNLYNNLISAPLFNPEQFPNLDKYKNRIKEVFK